MSIQALKAHSGSIAIGYVRCSTEKQEREGYSLTQQVQEIEQYCRDQGMLLVAIFREIESAKSASGRPLFQAAIRHLLHNHSDILVFTNWDRFARNTIDNELIRRSLAQKGKRLIATQQHFLSTSFDPEEDEELEAALAHAAVDNEKERKKIRKRLVRGRRQKISQGGWNGHRPPYEYDIIQGEPVLNIGRWQVIRRIVRLRKWRGMTYRQIAEYLNSQKIPGYSGRITIKRRSKNKCQRSDGTWASRSVAKIITDWYSGKRQAWREFYEAKRLEREREEVSTRNGGAL